MREIKFRVWSRKNKRFLDDNQIAISLLGTVLFIPEIDSDMEGWTTTHLGGYDISQYTGLKDKNGKEMYEGDILEYLSGTEDSFKDVVKWEDSGFNIDSCELHEGNVFVATIVGNIYENPELLK